MRAGKIGQTFIEHKLHLRLGMELFQPLVLGAQEEFPDNPIEAHGFMSRNTPSRQGSRS